MKSIFPHKWMLWLLVLSMAMLPIVLTATEWATVALRPPDGVPQQRWASLVALLRAKPYAVAELQSCLDEVEAAAKEGLPTATILSRLEEGAAKQVEAAALRAAVFQRLESLKTAQQLLRDGNYGNCPEVFRAELLSVLASACENRVPTDGLRRVLKREGVPQTGRLIAAIEGAETLKLVGLDDDTVTALMDDFVVRDLQRGEILRAVRYAAQRHREGVAGRLIREALWSSSGGEWRGRGHGTRYGRSR